MDIAEIRAEIKQQLGDTDLRVYAVVPPNPIAPCLAIFPEHILYGDTYDGKNQITLVVWCLAGMVEQIASQVKLDAWLSDTGTESIVAALDRATNGGVMDSTNAVEMRSYGGGPLKEGGPSYLSAEFVIDVLA